MTDATPMTLNNGVAIPQLGFGVFQVPPEQAEQAVAGALEAGYRSIDTAAAYRNEAGVGAAAAASGIERAELFITTKLWNADQGYDATLRAFDASLAELGMDYADMYLIHWPVPERDDYVASWQALEKLYADGRVRAIGVSNFEIEHLRRLFEETSVVPAVNQIELHPRLQQTELRAFHAGHGIATEAWSPLGQGQVMTEDAVQGLASKYAKTPAQIIIRWHLQLGNVVIPKTVTRSRMSENLDIDDFELAEDDLAVLAELDTGARIGPDPATMNVDDPL